MKSQGYEDKWSEYITCAALVLILGAFFITIPVLISLGCAALWVAAIFSKTLRNSIRQHRLLHALWVFVAVAIALQPSTRGYFNAARTAETQDRIAAVRGGIKAYEDDYRQPPVAHGNAELVKILLGNNPRKIDYLQPKPPQVNAQGELVDGWGTPLRVCLRVPQKPVIRSAGPDKKWGTADDLADDPDLKTP